MTIDTVTNLNDSGAGSLRAVLAAATAGDTIEFQSSLAGGTINLASLLDITKNVTIEGLTSGQNITLNGGSIGFTDVKVEASETVSLDGLDIIGGKGTGAAGSGSTSGHGNAGASAAGGIFNAGTLAITNSVISGNAGTGGAGAAGPIFGGGGAGGAAAGGIYNASGASLTVNLGSDTFASNKATGGYGGAAGGGYYSINNASATRGHGGYATSSGTYTAATAGSKGFSVNYGFNYSGAGGAVGNPGSSGASYRPFSSPGPTQGPGGGGGGGRAFANYGGAGSLTVIPACFAAGTRILTARGEVPVEALRTDDAAITLSGRTAPVRWIGHRRTAPARHPRPWDHNPVRIRAGALAPGQPRRDLIVSPDHALFLAGNLFRARELLNGATIVQEGAETITYFHVELDRHDVLLAEGAPAESFLDTGNRAAFENGGPALMAHPQFARAVWAEAACAPLVLEGALLAAVRENLAARAEALGWHLTEEPDLHLGLRGYRLRPAELGPTMVFNLPPDTQEVTLRSRANVPAYVLPGNADTRRLGIAVASLALDGVAVPLAGDQLGAGWLAPEPRLRWTDGAATLRVDGAHRLALRTVALGLPYWLAPVAAAAAEEEAA